MNTKRDRAFCDAPGDATDSIKFYCRFPYRNDEAQIMCDWLPARYQENYICFNSAINCANLAKSVSNALTV